MIQKEEAKGYLNIHFKRVLQVWNMFEGAKKLPKYLILLELPQPGMLLPDHLGGVLR